MRTFVFPLALLAACGEDAATPPGFTSDDVRLDAAPDGIESLNARMCATGANLATAWAERRDDVGGIWVNASVDGGESWAGAVEISGTPATADHPSIGCDGDRVAVAWEDTRDGELDLPNIWFASSEDAGATWAAAQRIEVDSYGRYASTAPAVAVVGADVYVAWMDQLYGAYDIFFAASHDGGATFATPLRLDGDSAGSAWSGWPVIAAEEGQVAVAWEDTRYGLADIYLARSIDGGATWGPPMRVDGGDGDGASDSHAPALAVEDGALAVAWHDQRDGEGFGVYFNWSPDGYTWLIPALRLDGAVPGAFDSMYPQVALKDGVAHVAWEDTRNTDRDVYYRQVKDGVPGGEVLVDHNDVGQESFGPRVVAGDAGVVVAWVDTRYDVDNSMGDLFYQVSADGGATWGSEDLRLNGWEGGTTYAADLSIALAPTATGDALAAAWADGRNGSTDVWFHALTPGDQDSNPDSSK